MLNTFFRIFLLFLVTTLGGRAAIFEFYTFWAKPGELSPDKRFIYGSGSLLYDAASLLPRYHFDSASAGYFSKDGSQYIYHDYSKGLHRFTFETGKDESIADLEGISYVYRSPDARSFLFVTDEVSEATGKDQISIYSKLDGEPLVQLASFSPESLETINPIEIKSHPEEDVVLFEVQEYSSPTTPMGDGTYSPRRIYELNIELALNLGQVATIV
jgi:hypothetical protein